MPSAESPASWRDPQYVATIVGVLATGGVLFYAALNDGPPTPETAILVLFVVFVPWTIAYAITRRWL